MSFLTLPSYFRLENSPVYQIIHKDKKYKLIVTSQIHYDGEGGLQKEIFKMFWLFQMFLLIHLFLR